MIAELRGRAFKEGTEACIESQCDNSLINSMNPSVARQKMRAWWGLGTDGHVRRWLVSLSHASSIGLWGLIRIYTQLLMGKQTRSSQMKTMWVGLRLSPW